MFKRNSKNIALLVLTIFSIVILAAIKLDQDTAWLMGITPHTCPSENDESVSKSDVITVEIDSKVYKFYAPRYKMSETYHSLVTSKRVDNGALQVKDPVDIVPGQMYIAVRGQNNKSLIAADSYAYRTWKGEWVYDFHDVDDPSYKGTNFLSDYGVVPYDSGCWHKTNYLSFAD